MDKRRDLNLTLQKAYQKSVAEYNKAAADIGEELISELSANERKLLDAKVTHWRDKRKYELDVKKQALEGEKLELEREDKFITAQERARHNKITEEIGKVNARANMIRALTKQQSLNMTLSQGANSKATDKYRKRFTTLHQPDTKDLATIDSNVNVIIDRMPKFGENVVHQAFANVQGVQHADRQNLAKINLETPEGVEDAKELMEKYIALSNGILKDGDYIKMVTDVNYMDNIQINPDTGEFYFSSLEGIVLDNQDEATTLAAALNYKKVANTIFSQLIDRGKVDSKLLDFAMKSNFVLKKAKLATSDRAKLKILEQALENEDISSKQFDKAIKDLGL
jgi:hypothetical protein